ncbi:hypothetical protein MRB53_010000 [Persea americana]|uniref:Uncharacterized protein n=1 Tax=Persea americana TaxID=3435 RepID=A0ACC2LRC5_PERAE|nr:hypothetical protein MRB53_010000 [Persea americana]
MSFEHGGRRGRDNGALCCCAGGAVCAWRKKGQRSAGVREMKSRETGGGAASEMGLRRGCEMERENAEIEREMDRCERDGRGQRARVLCSKKSV